MRYVISIPYYAERLEDVEQAMDDIAKAIEVPYISVTSKPDKIRAIRGRCYREQEVIYIDKEYL